MIELQANPLLAQANQLDHQPPQANPLSLGLSLFTARDIINPKPLSEYTIQQISGAAGIFNCGDLSTSKTFDTVSISLLLNIAQPAEVFSKLKPLLTQIFTNLFTPALLNRHLNNMITFMLCSECREFIPYFKWSIIDAERLIKNQLSLLSTNSLIEAAKWTPEGPNQDFLRHLVLFLELNGKHQSSESHNQTKPQSSLLPNAVRNFLISDAMLSDETPTSLFEANAVYSSQVMKLTAGATMAFATAPVLGPYSALFLGIPFLISLTSKAYFKSLNAPPNVYPLFDSREIDLSHAENFLGRDEIIQEILSVWKTNKHPLLVGSPGVGKTTIMELIIQRIAAGIIPGFETRVAFMGSAAQVMAPNPMGPPHLERMVKAILPFRNNVILALDEFHVLTADRTSSTYVRTMLDDSSGSIRYGLFATTTEDYQNSIQRDESLCRRLKVIDVNALSRNSLLHLLHREVKLANPNMDATPEAIARIYEHTEGRQNESRQLLYRIVREVELKNRNRPCYTQRQELKDEIQMNESFGRGSFTSVTAQNRFLDQIALARINLRDAEKECHFFDLVFEKYDDLLRRSTMLSRELCNSSRIINEHLCRFVGEEGALNDKISALSNPVLINQIQNTFKQMLFQRYFNRSSLIKFLDDYANLFQFTHVIDLDCVNSLLVENPRAIEIQQNEQIQNEEIN